MKPKIIFVVFVIASLLTMWSVARACESFTDCMESGDANGWSTSGSIATMEEIGNRYYLKAIALKLDEIYKKLDDSRITPAQKKRLDIEEAVIVGRQAYEERSK